jgi:hypothetical protein
MMIARGFLSGAGPYVKRYQAGTTISTAGVPLLGAVDAATDLGSVEVHGASEPVLPGTHVGLCLSTSGTVGATGVTDSDDLYVEVIVNPDLVIGARMCNGTTSGTALTIQAATAASSTGVIATGVTSYDNGAMYGVAGANAGALRRTDDASGGVAINYVNAIAIGDTFVAVNGFPCSIEQTDWQCYDLTTDLTEAVATTEVTDRNDFATLDVRFDPFTPALNSEYELVSNNHLFGSSSIA